MDGLSVFTVLTFEFLESTQAIEADVVLTVSMIAFVVVTFGDLFAPELYETLRFIISMNAHDTMC